MNSPVSLHIDIEKAIKNKAPQKSQKIPNFVYRFLSWLICQDQLNVWLDKNANSFGVDFARNVLHEMNVSVEMIGEENIPEKGKFIFASNHPLGGLDGMALISLFGKRFDNKVRFIVNDLLMNITNLASVFIPINKHGAQNKESAQLIHEAFESDNQILIFPAGLCSRLQQGHIRDLEWKKAVIAKSVEYQRDIIPVFFDGKNSSFFYKLAYWRMRLGVKVNIEMALLPREMVKNQNGSFKIYLGKPIPWQTFDKSRTQKQWADFLKNKVYELQK